MGSAHGRFDPPPRDRNRAVDRGSRDPRLVAHGDRRRAGRLHPLRQACGQPGGDRRPDRRQLVLLPAPSLGHPPPGDGHRRGLRARRQQDLRGPDDRRLRGPDGGIVVLHSGSTLMSLGDSASPLRKVRGLGAAGEGGEHWLTERVTSIALLLLGTWLIASLLILPQLDRQTIVEWLRPPSGAVPMALLIVVGFKHALDGMKVVVDDYVHDEGRRFATNTLLLFLAVGGGAIALYALAAIVFGG